MWTPRALAASARCLERAFLPPARRLCQPSLRPCSTTSGSISLLGSAYPRDSWSNVTPQIAKCIGSRLHLQPNHPISITRQLIESQFPPHLYTRYNKLSPVVSTAQNFDSLGFPLDHPGRAKTDTYYVNETTVLRTHTSAHQLDLFRKNASPGFLVSADVYRRDAIDRSHYPVFHQMEGARAWDMNTTTHETINAEASELAALSKDLEVMDPNPPFHETRNPLQPQHSPEIAAAAAAHLKRSLEAVVVEVFGKARAAATMAASISGYGSAAFEPLQVRWVETYFPFTSPSWELEVLWQGNWLELLGCGIVQHQIFKNANLPSHMGWAFGVGLERIAMVLFGIPDIRLFWSQDERFLKQFAQGHVCRFQEFSKYPSCRKDVAFWVGSACARVDPAEGRTGTGIEVHANDVMEIVRGVAGDMVEDVELIDEFIHPKTGRKSLCYRVHYRSLERTLTNEEVNARHEELRKALVETLGVELR
ncbi:hypothetical protein BDZ91DRAFT_691633 [Kalaharituber pfeilii]|nr:hypothetical protein BDZ91DRAFT_691633 [Kalaharituber pfeilii]